MKILIWNNIRIVRSKNRVRVYQNNVEVAFRKCKDFMRIIANAYNIDVRDLSKRKRYKTTHQIADMLFQHFA